MRYSEELIAHAYSNGMQDRLALRWRRYEMFRRWLEVDNISQVGREFGVTPAWGRELIYHARFDLIRNDESRNLTIESPTVLFLEAVDNEISKIQELVKKRGGFFKRREYVSKKKLRKERLRQESDLYADLEELYDGSSMGNIE